MDFSTLGSKQDIHTLGVSYLCSFLDRVGFTILKCNTALDHHFQILAKIHDKSLLIAVRTSCRLDAVPIESSTLEALIKESEGFGALPHFAGLSVIPLAANDSEDDGLTGDHEYRVIFNGIRAVRKSALRAVNE